MNLLGWQRMSERLCSMGIGGGIGDGLICAIFFRDAKKSQREEVTHVRLSLFFLFSLFSRFSTAERIGR